MFPCAIWSACFSSNQSLNCGLLPDFLNLNPTLPTHLATYLFSFVEFLISFLSLSDRKAHTLIQSPFYPVWPGLGIFCTLGYFLKPWATINLPKSHIFLGNSYKGVKIFNFSSKIIFGQLLKAFGDFFWSHCFYHTQLIPLSLCVFTPSSTVLL